MSENAQKPRIRFKGFSDAWEQRKLGEVAIYRRGSFPQPYGKKEWYDGNGAMSFVQVADVTDEMNLVENTKQKISTLAQPMSVYADKNSVLVTLQGSIGRVAITQYGAFIDRTVLIFEKYKEPINILFWAYIIKQKFIEEAHKAPGGTIKTITKEALSDFDLLLPKYDEQSRVGAFFKQLDNLITLHQCKVFYKNIIFKNIKFGGLETENNTSWEQRKFEDAFIERREKTVTENEDTLLSCAINGMFLNSELFGHFRGTTTIGYLKVKKNDLILSAQNLHLGNANVNLRFEHGIISPAYKVYDLNYCEPEFVQAWVKKEDTKNFFLAATTEGASQCRKNIEWDTLGKQTICMPAIKEQATIGAFFKCVDNLITLHQRIKIFFTGDYHDKKNK